MFELSIKLFPQRCIMPPPPPPTWYLDEVYAYLLSLEVSPKRKHVKRENPRKLIKARFNASSADSLGLL